MKDLWIWLAKLLLNKYFKLLGIHFYDEPNLFIQRLIFNKERRAYLKDLIKAIISFVIRRASS